METRSKALTAAVFAALLYPQPAAASDTSLTLGAQYRPRLEVRQTTATSAPTQLSVSHRARLTVGLTRGAWSILLQPQHVLGWGSEAGSLAAGSGTLDFHQALIRGRFGDTHTVVVTIGRQELIHDDHRILGSVNWAQQARAFDAVHAQGTLGDKATVSAFAALLAAGTPENEHLFGMHGKLSFGMGHSSLSLLAEQSRKRANGDREFVRVTPGAQVNLTLLDDKLTVHGSGYGQVGSVLVAGAEMSYAAWLAALELSTQGEQLGRAALGVDVLSGDNNPTDTNLNTFDTLFATNHKFYGFADYFLNVPVHTGGLGLVDLHASYRRAFGSVTPLLALHLFQAQQESAAGNRLFGGEIDAQLSMPVAKTASLAAGYALMIAGDALVDIGRARANGAAGHWAFVQLNVQFDADVPLGAD